MKIKELESLLSVSRSNIRFYEKQGLFSPEREGNNYRDYTQQDVLVLKRIIVLRKMGFTVEEIKQIQNNELAFSDAIRSAQQRLEEEIEQLNGSLKLVKQVSKENTSFEEMDIPKHWDAINRSETAGEKFTDICRDYLELERNLFDNMWKFVFFHNFKKSREKHGVVIACVILLLLCVLRGISKALFWNESFWSGFFYPFVIALAASVIVLPLFLLHKKYPKAASIVSKILSWVILLFFAGIILLLIYSILT